MADKKTKLFRKKNYKNITNFEMNINIQKKSFIKQSLVSVNVKIFVLKNLFILTKKT